MEIKRGDFVKIETPYDISIDYVIGIAELGGIPYIEYNNFCFCPMYSCVLVSSILRDE